MRTPGLATIIMAFAIAACSDVAEPIAMGPDASSIEAVGHRSHWDAPRHGGHKFGDNKQTCDNDDRRWGKRSHHSRFRHWGWRRHDHRHWSFRRHDKNQGECGGGEAKTGSISGTVTNDRVLAASYSVFLLNADGSVAAGTTTDATGAYSFAAVQAGAYVVCEDNPFTEAHGYLGQVSPQTGGTCPRPYASIGFSVTLAAGATLTGHDFSNMRLD